MGRQNSLIMDAMGTYDPQQLAQAFSILGYSGFGAGAGDTDLGRWDNSVKYVYQYGPAHVAGMIPLAARTPLCSAMPGERTPGFTYKGLSVDALYQREYGAASLSNLSATEMATAGVNINSLDATISDNTAWSVQGKYVFDLANGGFKDETGAKLTLYGGAEHIQMANPDSPVTSGTVLGGYAVNAFTNNNYYTDRNEWIVWTGASYAACPGRSLARIITMTRPRS